MGLFDKIKGISKNTTKPNETTKIDSSKTLEQQSEEAIKAFAEMGEQDRKDSIKNEEEYRQYIQYTEETNARLQQYDNAPGARHSRDFVSKAAEMIDIEEITAKKKANNTRESFLDKYRIQGNSHLLEYNNISPEVMVSNILIYMGVSPQLANNPIVRSKMKEKIRRIVKYR